MVCVGGIKWSKESVTEVVRDKLHQAFRLQDETVTIGLIR